MAASSEWTQREASLSFGITIYGDTDEALDAEARRIMEAATAARTLEPPEGAMGAHAMSSVQGPDGRLVSGRPWVRVRQAICG